jgi:hypothetical protein
VRRLASTRYWIDIMCKNQHVVNSGDTAAELSECVRACGKTVLACSPWNDPTCLRRVWCQYEIHHTHMAGAQLYVAYPFAEKLRMDQSMYSWSELFAWLCSCDHSESPTSSTDHAKHETASRRDDAAVSAAVGSSRLRRTISELAIVKARATVASDRRMILAKIAADFGGNHTSSNASASSSSGSSFNSGSGSSTSTTVSASTSAGVDDEESFESGPNAVALAAADRLIRLAAIDGMANALGCATQLPLSQNIARLTTFAQVLVALCMCRWLELLPLALFEFLAPLAIALYTFSMSINAAAKSHQLVRLLEFAVAGDCNSDSHDAVISRDTVASIAGVESNDVAVALNASVGASITASDRLVVFRQQRRRFLLIAACLCSAMCFLAVIMTL